MEKMHLASLLTPINSRVSCRVFLQERILRASSHPCRLGAEILSLGAMDK